MRVIILLTAYAMLHDCVMGCGSNEPAKVTQPNAAAQKNQPDKIWTLCCMAGGTTNIRGCVSRTVNDTKNTFPKCDDNDERVMFLTCLEHSDPCRFISNNGFLFVIYKKKGYDADLILDHHFVLIIMLNKVERSKFFVKTTEQMRQVMVANKSANAGESNYWIGLDMMYSLTHLQFKQAALKLYVNGTSFFTGRYKSFKVEDFSEKFKFLAGDFDGDDEMSDLNQFDPSSSLTPIKSTFFGSEDMDLFCNEVSFENHTSWWYGHNSENEKCSFSILTTEDGKHGWGTDVIQAAIMAIEFY